MTKARDLANASTALSAVSATELAFVDGVTSAIQTQMDAKAPSSTAVTLTGTQTLTNKTLTSPVISSVINNTLTSTTGDIIYASAANTPARLGIGSTAQVLTVASGVPSWATPATPASGLTLITSTDFSAVTTASVNSCFSATYSRYKIIVNFNSTGGGTDVRVKMRVSGTDSSAASYHSKTMFAESAGVWQTFWGNGTTTGFNGVSNMPASGGILTFDISNPFQSQQTNATMQGGHTDRMTVGTWSFAATTSFDGLSFLSTTANTITGNYKIYGYQES